MHHGFYPRGTDRKAKTNAQAQVDLIDAVLAFAGVEDVKDMVDVGCGIGGAALARRVSRFECLPHTEGCGTGYAEGGMQLYERVMLGHLTHPSVAMALCLEHGCEKTHNDFFHNAMASAGVSSSAFGYASIQLDGGIEAVTERVLAYVAGRAAAPPAEDAEAEAMGAAPLDELWNFLSPLNSPEAPGLG